MARPRTSNRLLVEQLKDFRLSVRRLSQWWQPNLAGELSRQFSEGKPLAFWITLDLKGHSISVQVIADRPHFGGVRLWFRCPQCDRRVLSIYQCPGQPVLGCRVCFRLVYGQQMRKGRSLWDMILRFMAGIPEPDPCRFQAELKKWQRERKRRGRLEKGNSLANSARSKYLTDTPSVESNPRPLSDNVLLETSKTVDRIDGLL